MDPKERHKLWQKNITKQVWIINAALQEEKGKMAEMERKIEEVQARVQSSKVAALLRRR